MTTSTIADSVSDGAVFGAFDVEHAVQHAAHLLPSQGPIEVFVHHNTLHAFEDLPFEEAVRKGLELHGANPWLSEDQYRRRMAVGRIRVQDLERVLLEDLREYAEILVANLGTRYALRLAMLQFPLQSGSQAELNWVIAETDALRRFRPEVPMPVRRRAIEEMKRWLTSRDSRHSVSPRRPSPHESLATLVAGILPQISVRDSSHWNDRQWEAFVLQLLWQVCIDGVIAAKNGKAEADSRQPVTSEYSKSNGRPVASDQQNSSDVARTAHRPRLSAEAAEAVNSLLIQFCSTFLDQGFADWEVPRRNAGLYETFLHLYRQPLCSPTRWLGELNREVTLLYELQLGPVKSIQQSLTHLHIPESQREEYIREMLLALPGWAGMIWQMETNAEWSVHPAPSGSLLEYLAVRLIVERVAGRVFPEPQTTQPWIDESIVPPEDRARWNDTAGEEDLRHAFTIFQLAQVRGWDARDLHFLSSEQWGAVVREIDAFHSLERRRIYHRAFEKKYRDDTLNALMSHTVRQVRARHGTADDSQADGLIPSRATFQLVCCIDDREESFRRHVEEVEPNCETFGMAGFYGIAMYYRGVTDAHFRPLCPVNIKPQHFVTEEPIYSFARLSERQAATRRRIGRATHQAHLGSRTFLGGVLTGLFGSIAAFPLVARILFPRTSARLRNLVGQIVRPTATQLRIERLADTPGDSNGQLGYSVSEMAAIVENGLRCIGLADTSRLSPLVLICGHGSGSVNNPHESAYNCGACSGGRGGPNARAFSQMANDHRVRELLRERGLPIPEDVHFVGGFHDTCDDSLTWYDLDLLPIRLRAEFERAQSVLDEARARSAKERCRRFASAPLNITPAEALAHVEGRSEDLSQARPEYNHATCALCFVGRREWSRNLFLDRRAFLTSYDPRQDDENSQILERLLQAVIPVCAGISLEYYFSTVDNEAYGCGNKLPHNLTSLLGVMTGAASDLRPGLAAQMVEIHEPMRILFVVETTVTAMTRIIRENPAIHRLLHGDWVQLAVFDPDQSMMKIYQDGKFVAFHKDSTALPMVASSLEWTSGKREHLGFASVIAQGVEV